MKLTLKNFVQNKSDFAKKTMAISSSGSQTTALSINAITADTIILNYHSMPGNQPNSYGNYVACWQNSNMVPWSNSPILQQKILTNNEDGNLALNGLNPANNSYIVGYAVGPELKGSGMQLHGNICAYEFLSAGGQTQGVKFSSNIKVAFLSATAMALDYTLPAGNTPKNNGAWIGLWQSSIPSYNNPPIASTLIQQNTSAGTVILDNLAITNNPYTVGLFMSGWKGAKSLQTALACSVTVAALS